MAILMLHQYHLHIKGRIVEAYGFDSPDFTVDGKKYTIVGSDSYGNGAMDVRHTIKFGNQRKEVELRKLVKLWKDKRLI